MIKTKWVTFYHSVTWSTKIITIMPLAPPELPWKLRNFKLVQIIVSAVLRKADRLTSSYKYLAISTQFETMVKISKPPWLEWSTQSEFDVKTSLFNLLFAIQVQLKPNWAYFLRFCSPHSANADFEALFCNSLSKRLIRILQESTIKTDFIGQKKSSFLVIHIGKSLSSLTKRSLASTVRKAYNTTGVVFEKNMKRILEGVRTCPRLWYGSGAFLVENSSGYLDVWMWRHYRFQIPHWLRDLM